MNWTDILVIAIIGGFAILGLSKGLIYSLFRLASFFVSAIVAINFWPLASKIISPVLFPKVKDAIAKGLPDRIPGLDSQAAATAVVDQLSLPGFIKPALLKAIPDPNKLIDTATIFNMIAENLARFVVAIVSMVALFILVRILLIFAHKVLQGISQLPVLKQMDKIGGFGIGALEGLLSIYIVFAVVMIFSGVPQLKPVFDAIQGSNFIAKMLYENNLLVDWMLPESGIF